MWIIVVVSSLCVLVSALSLLAASATRKEAKSLRVSFETIASITGIWNRDEITNLVGPAGNDRMYCISNEQISLLPRTKWRKYVDRQAHDWLCLTVSVVAIAISGQYPFFAAALCVGSAAYLCVTYIAVIVMTARAGVWSEWITDTRSENGHQGASEQARVHD